ncbi:MAG: (Fe-S)-binding protein [Planctomycetaceae bacterium]|jgi:Fe-S oxidoreductase|nr:(Fe-S)-binding protein [Planctomycetaceae bacterium]
MNLSQKNKETINSCRFCWMCRHICPIGNATGQERNTPRARALGMSFVLRNNEKPENIINNIYECSLCGACTKECVTGWNPVAVILEARREGIFAGIVSDSIKKMIGNFEKTGNIYGITKIDTELLNEIKSLPPKSDTLLFLGKDTTYKNPQGALNAIRLLKKIGNDFTVLSDEPDSGYAIHFLVGSTAETKNLFNETAKKLDFETIIVYDPCDAKIFLREYKEWGIDVKSQIKTWTSHLAQQIENGTLKPKRTDLSLTFQDHFALARDLEETEPARKILRACGSIREMLLHGKETVFAGSLLMREYLPNEINLVAQERWNSVINSGADVVVTCSTAEYICLNENKIEQKSSVTQLLSIEELVLKCL